MSINRYKNNKPKFILEKFFSGEISAWGLFEDPFGIIRKRFTCKITGKWDDKLKTLKIIEDFLYDDGVKELDEIRAKMSSDYEMPPLDMIG